MTSSRRIPRPSPLNNTDTDSVIVPFTGASLRVAVRAMACEFGAIVSPGETELLLECGAALETVPEIESWLSIYQRDSELSRLNEHAAERSVPVSVLLFGILQRAIELFDATEGAFDMASGAQIRLWRRCRNEQRIPTDDEVRDAVGQSGMNRIQLAEESRGVRFPVPGFSLDPGAIGKGFALDEVCSWLERDGCSGDFVLHGGQSSLVARGTPTGGNGWPIGIGNPLLTKRRLGTVILRNQAMSTSGSNIQFYRCEGRRFGHILDPRTGWPVDGMLSVTVLADSAAVADAVSTAFFVLGVENAEKCCDNIPGVGAILIPFPEQGALVQPIVIGIPPDQIAWDEDQVAVKPQ